MYVSILTFYWFVNLYTEGCGSKPPAAVEGVRHLITRPVLRAGGIAVTPAGTLVGQLRQATDPHSYRRALTGSRRLPRQAGTYPAAHATRANAVVARARVAGSCGVRPKSWLWTSLVSARDAGRARPTPMAMSKRTSRITSQITLPCVAPRAMRMPTSRVRCATV